MLAAISLTGMKQFGRKGKSIFDNDISESENDYETVNIRKTVNDVMVSLAEEIKVPEINGGEIIKFVLFQRSYP